MINWDYIQENHPEAFKEYMKKSWTLEDFWNAYEVYVRCSIIEDETGCELWDWKISSKLVIYSSLCYKTIIKDGKKITVYTFDEVMQRRLKQIFKIIDDQIKNQNYLNN
tara:strand:- start:522 stop:848 length:327 start_codon:yes stop_codon:yes gene_type:complete